MPSSNTSGFILTHLVEIFVTQAHMFLSSLKTSTAQRERTYRITAKRTSFCCKPPVDTDRWLTFFTSSTPERPTKTTTTTVAADCWPHHRGWMGGSVWSLGKAIVPIHTPSISVVYRGDTPRKWCQHPWVSSPWSSTRFSGGNRVTQSSAMCVG